MKKLAGCIFSFLWRGWFILVAIITTLFLGTLIYVFSFNNNQKQFTYKLMRLWGKTIFYASGMRYHIEGNLEDLPKEPYIVISNHTSMMDIMLMYTLNKHPMVFVGKAELAKMPILGAVFKRTNILVNRTDLKSRTKVIQLAANKIKDGYSICLFPEGGVPDVRVFLAPFKEGAFALAKLQKSPMVVFTFCGLKKFLPYAYCKGRPGKVRVFLEQLYSVEQVQTYSIQELKTKSREKIENRLNQCG